MKTQLMIIGALIMTLAAAPAFAVPQLYVDSAPNVYGSSDYTPWWDAAKSDVVAGTFSNLSNGTYPGTLDIHAVDEIVYSWGDLGKRLHWVYWLENTTLAALEGNFQVKYVVDWDGEAFTYDWSAGDWAADEAETGWVQPGSWSEYEEGVIGTFGHAWWAGYGVTDPGEQQAALDDLISDVLQYQTFARGLIRYRDDASSEWQTQSLEVTVVPEPATLGFFALGALGCLLRRRRA